MKAYALQDLLDIRAIREGEAKDAVTVEQRRVRELLEELEKTRLELQQYHDWRVKQEGNEYNAVIQKKIVMRRLEQLRGAIAMLRDAEVGHEKKVSEAETAVQQARESLQKAQDRHRTAQKDLEKIEEHKQIWRVEWDEEQARVADIELEDLAGRKREREEQEDREEYEEAHEGEEDDTD